MTIFTIFLVLIFCVGIPYLIYKAFVEKGGWIPNTFANIRDEQDKPLDDAQS